MIKKIGQDGSRKGYGWWKLVIPFFPLVPFFPFLTVADGANPPRVIERVVAVVNGEPIVWSDVEVRRVLMGRQTGAAVDAEKVVEMLIDEAVVKYFAKKAYDEKKIDVFQGDIETQFRAIKDRYPDEKDFLEDLQKEGVTVEKLKERIRVEVLQQKLVDVEVRSKIAVSDRDVDDYYEKHRSEFQEPDRLIIANIRIDSEKKAQKALVDLKAGKTFLELLKLYGDEESQARQGKGVEFGSQDLRPVLWNVVKDMKAGEISEPVQDEGFWYMLKVEDRVLGRQMTLVDKVKVEGQDRTMRELTKHRLMGIRMGERLDAWLKSLRAMSAIERKPLKKDE